MNSWISTKHRRLIRRTLAAVLTLAVGFQLNLAAVVFSYGPVVSVARAEEPPPDTAPPTVSLSAPAANDTLVGTVTVTAAASDNVGVASVQLKLDGANLGNPMTAEPYSYSWNTTAFTDGTHTLTGTATDGAGNTAASDSVVVTVSNQPPDTTPPVVSIAAPAANEIVVGTVTITASASDNVGVASVQLKLDDANLGGPLTAEPYTYSWDTTATSNGPHQLVAEAIDGSSNAVSSTAISVTVHNPDVIPPTVSMTAPAANEIVVGTVTITASASDNVGVASVQLKLDDANLGEPLTAPPYAFAWDTTHYLNGPHAISALATDSAGNVATAHVVTVTINNPDATPPTIRITEPDGGSSVNGTVPLTAEANDNVGLFNVQFRVNAQNSGPPLTAAPYNASWDTTDQPNGCYKLTAVATDLANNAITSDEVLVVVNHNPPPPCPDGDTSCTPVSNVTNTNVGEFANCASSSSNTGVNSSNGHDSPTTTDIITGDATAGVLVPSVVNTNLTEVNGGSGDPNVDLTVNNNNQATLVNDVQATATTGDNEASGNRKSNISTGDANVFTWLINTVNTNVVGSAFNAVVDTITGMYEGTINFLEMMIQLMEGLNQQFGGQNFNLTVNNTSQGVITNNVDINAATGNNTTDDNRYGSITTGNVNVGANFLNFLNTNIVGSNWLFSAINVIGDFVGDIILPGEGVLDAAFGTNLSQLTIENNNQAEIINRININGDTGTNDATGNRDGALVNTGDVNLQTSILNTVNTNIVGGSLFGFLPHIFGSWEGQVIDGPASTPWQQYHTGDENGNVTVANTNDATIHNNLTINASTGGNHATGNRRASINTGNINVAANMVNLANTNIVGSNLLFGHFNVYGTWRGNIVYAYPDLTVSNHHDGQQLHPGDQVTYTLRFANQGLAPARDVRLADLIPDHTTFVSASDGGAFQNGEVTWNLGRLGQKTTARAVSFTVQINLDLPVGDTVLRNSVVIITPTRESQQINNMSTSELTVTVAPPPPPTPPSSPSPPPPPTPPLTEPVPLPSNQAAAITPDPQLTIRKSNDARQPLQPGESVAFTIEVENNGNVDVENLLIHDVLPGRSATLFEKDFPLERLAVGETMRVSYSLTVSQNTAPGRYTNTATVRASYQGSALAPHQATSNVDIRAAESSQVTAPKTPSTPSAPTTTVVKPKKSSASTLVVTQKNYAKRGRVAQGGKVNFLVTVTNKGKTVLKNVILFGKMINGATHALSWKLGSLAPGTAIKFSYTLDLIATAPLGKYLSQTTAKSKTASGQNVASNTAETKFTVIKRSLLSRLVAPVTAAQPGTSKLGRFSSSATNGYVFFNRNNRPISAWQYAQLYKVKLVDLLRGSGDPIDRKFIEVYTSGLTLVGQRGKDGKIITVANILNDLRKLSYFRNIFGTG